MGEHMFGSGNGKLTHASVEQIDEVAGSFGCVINNPKLPGQGYRYWFAGPNRGNPFDQEMERNVWSALEAAGLAEDNGLSPKCFAGEEWIVEGRDEHGQWNWYSVAGTLHDATYDSEEAAERAIDSLVETCGWERSALRARATQS